MARRPKSNRVVLCSGLFYVIEAEASIQDRIKELGEWKVVDTDAPADAFSAEAKP